jgi:hypothetical protein
MKINWENGNDAASVRRNAPNFISAIVNSIKNDLEVSKALKNRENLLFNVDKGFFWVENEQRQVIGRSFASEHSFPKNYTGSVWALPKKEGEVDLAVYTNNLSQEREQTKTKDRNR